jgi:carbonic anhydrase
MHRRHALKILAGFVLCLLCASASFGTEHHWSYGGEAEPDKWGSLDPADATCSAGGQHDIVNAITARPPSCADGLWQAECRR